MSRIKPRRKRGGERIRGREAESRNVCEDHGKSKLFNRAFVTLLANLALITKMSISEDWLWCY